MLQKRLTRTYNPPFLKPSFVKLDSLSRVYKKNYKNLRILNSGNVLDQDELNNIKVQIY